MKERFQPIPKRRLSDAVVEQLKALLVGHELKPGDKLPPERQLCALFQVGRPSVREAIRTLSVMGFLDVRPGDGVYVKDPDADLYLAGFQESFRFLLDMRTKTLFEVAELRTIIETQTGSLAANIAGKEDIKLLEEKIENLRRHLDNPQLYLEEDLEFHRTIARLTGNTVIYRVIDFLTELIRESLDTSLEAHDIASIFHPDHEKIFSAIKSKSAEGAARAIREHLLHSQEFLTAKAKGEKEKTDAQRAQPVR